MTAPLVAKRACCVCREPVYDHGMQCARCRVGDYAHISPKALGLDGTPARLPDVELDLLETDVQTACIKTMQLLGWTVYRIGQYNAARTQDAGPSDLIGFHPECGVAFAEIKRSKGGVQSDDQRLFQAACESAGARYILTNDAHHLFAQLVQLKKSA